MRARVLSILHAFVALNAIGGGLYGVRGAPGVPVAWLEQTPFANYVVPGLLLLVVVGGAHGIASVAVGRRTPRARCLSLAAGVILLGWIGVQLAMIGYVSRLQPAVALASVANVVLAAALPRGLRVGTG